MDKHIEPLDERRICAAAGEYPPVEVIVLDETGSLMDDAAEAATQGCRHGTILVAEEQAAGRGRHGRTWDSAQHLGLYIAVLLGVEETGDPGSLTALTCGLAVCETAHDVGISNAEVKWPNDILVTERKIAGVLVSKKPADEVYIVGAGINVHHREDDFSPELKGKATSIYLETGRDVARNEVAGLLVRKLFEKSREFAQGERRRIIEEYKELCVTLGREVEIAEKGDVYYGTAEDIAGDGALLVRIDDEIKAFYSGDAINKG